MAMTKYERVGAPGSRVTLIVWRGLSADDVGEPFVLGGAAATMQMVGRFGGSVTLEGTLDSGSSPTWSPLTDPQANELRKTVPALERVIERVYKIRPQAGAGVGSVDVWLLVAAT